MKFAVSFITGAVALRVADVHPTVNLVVTNDGAMDANAFSLAQASKSKSLRAELKELVKSETHASLMEGDFHQPNVLRINFESPHAALMESIVRESVADGAAYEEGEIGLNLIPAGSAASLKQLMTKTDADFETEFRSGLHASLMEAIRIRLPKGGLKEGDSLVSDDGRIAVRVLPPRAIPGGFLLEQSSINELASQLEASGERAEAAVGDLLGMFAQGRVSKHNLHVSGAIDKCAGVMQSETASDAMVAGCGSVITHLTNTPVASSRMDANGGHGHVVAVFPSPARIYGA